MPSASARTVSVKSSRERVAAMRVSSHGTTRLPPTRMRAVSDRDLDHRERQAHRHARHRRRRAAKTAGIITSTSTVRRSSTTSQPTAIWPARVCRSRLSDSTRMRTTVLATERPMPNTEPGRPRPAERVRDGHAEARRDDALRHGAGHRDAPDGDELFDVELQPDAEHQQDDADLGQLLGHVPIRHEARRVAARRGGRRSDSRRWGRARRDAWQSRRRAPRRGRRPASESDRGSASSDFSSRLAAGGWLLAAGCWRLAARFSGLGVRDSGFGKA